MWLKSSCGSLSRVWSIRNMSIVNSLNLTCVTMGEAQSVIWTSWVWRYGSKQWPNQCYLESVNLSLGAPVRTKGKICDRITSLSSNRFYTTVKEKLEWTRDCSEQTPLIRSPMKEYETCSMMENFGRPWKSEKVLFCNPVLSQKVTILMWSEIVL